MNALNGGLSKVYREYLIRNQMIEAVISIPAKYFMNGTGMAFSLVVLSAGNKEIKFVSGEEYLGNEGLGVGLGIRNEGLGRILDVKRLLEDFKNLNDYEAIKTFRIDEVYSNDSNLMPDFYFGENPVYNNSQPFGKIVGEIRRGAKLPVSKWRAMDGCTMSEVKRVAFKHIGDGLIDETLPGLLDVPAGAETAILNEGDLLISRIGTPFKVAVVEKRIDKLVADENVWIVRMGGNRTLAYFLRAYLESEYGSKWLLRLSTGNSLRTISAKNIGKIPVPDVDEETREVIANELKKMTMQVQENRMRLKESLDAMKNVFRGMRRGELGIRN
jgi:type I restriction enzyme M protein